MAALAVALGGAMAVVGVGDGGCGGGGGGGGGGGRRLVPRVMPQSCRTVQPNEVGFWYKIGCRVSVCTKIGLSRSCLPAGRGGVADSAISEHGAGAGKDCKEPAC